MKSFTNILLLLVLSSVFSPSSSSSVVLLDTLTPDRPLFDNETLVSSNQTFVLGFFTPSTTSKNRYVGIWYNKVSIQTVVWVANRDNPIVDSSPATLSINDGGILVITTNSSTIILSTKNTTTSSPAAAATIKPIARISDMGNFVVEDGDRVIWQSFDYPTDSLLPGMKLGWNLTSGLNRKLTAWASLTDPSSSPDTVAIDAKGDAQLLLLSGSATIWRGGPWNGLRFTGIPEIGTYSQFTYNFVQNSEEVYYQYNVKDPSVISRLIANQSNVIQRWVWLEQVKGWNLFGYEPNDDCDKFSVCGQFGVCDTTESFICDCVQGFVARKPEIWALRDGSDGCIRKTQLDCSKNRTTDGFITINGVKLPDTSRSMVDMTLSLDQCRRKCLMNCSCTAYASAYINGTGCLIWTTNITDLKKWPSGGQDLYVRLAAADLGTKNRNRKVITVVVIITSVVVGIVLLAWMGLSCKRRKNRRRRSATLDTVTFTNSYSYQGSESKDFELPMFNLTTIVVATANFSSDNKLGEGGFGPVFKGILEDGQEIAVKRLAKTSAQGTDEFKNEVTLIAKLQHRNLVRLLGFCVQGEERMLVYEYLPNKSLDFFLFDDVNRRLLNWQTRYNIIIGIARGLLYLHQDSRFRIIHRDLKASNILLDKGMTPKISDFGLARIFRGDDTQVNTRKVVGTYGYMSPEYAMEGIFSVKSDIFSFGVLVLEIISGQRNTGVYHTHPDTNLLGHAWRLWREGNGLDLVDESATYSIEITEALRFINVGLLCVQERPEDRPTISSVISMLNSESSSPPQPKQPGFVSTRGPFQYKTSTTSLSKQAAASNEISITMCEGR